MLQCDICGTTENIKAKTRNNKFGKILCHRHYKQLYRHGKTFDRTIYDPNEIIKYDDFAEILLYDKSGNITHKAIIDLDDIDKVIEYKWSFGGMYASNSVNDILLHHLIIGKSLGYDVDHINRNKLDNRKSNLRIVSHADNMKNIKIPRDNKSGIIGVMWDLERSKWRAEIQYNGNVFHLGRHDIKEDAIRARLMFEHDVVGEFAPQRHLFKEYNIPS